MIEQLPRMRDVKTNVSIARECAIEDPTRFGISIAGGDELTAYASGKTR
jgi:hypothetical protein